MADSDHIKNQTRPIRRASLRGSTLPKLPTHAAPVSVALNDDPNFVGPRKKAHRRSPSALKNADDVFVSDAARQVFADESPFHPAAASSRNLAGDMGPPNPPYARERRSSSNVIILTTAPKGSGSSNGSGSTVRQSSSSRHDDATNPRNRQRRASAKNPNALNFLDSDSLELTPEVIQQSIETAARRSPVPVQSTSSSDRSTSSTSSSYRDNASDAVQDRETDRSTSPERSVNGDGMGSVRTPNAPRMEQGKPRRPSYGAPDIPYADANLPHLSPNAATPRAPNQGSFMYPPRADKLPLTGYALLASQLSTGCPNRVGRTLRPIYRRFEALNHRVLLYIQDEICELEEQLHQLDAADTQDRRLQGCLLPASRRAAQQAGSELHWRRMDILGKIGFKLEQYNNVLSSFRKNQCFPTPSPADIHDYRGFLATHRPLAEAETHFLDATDDLVCVDDGEDSDDFPDEDDTPATPMPSAQYDPRSAGRPGVSELGSPQSQNLRPQNISEQALDACRRVNNERPMLLPLSIGATGVVILPVLTFAVIPGYLGRMAVVVLVVVGALAAILQGNLGALGNTRDICIIAGCYGAVMAVLAGVATFEESQTNPALIDNICQQPLTPTADLLVQVSFRCMAKMASGSKRERLKGLLPWFPKGQPGAVSATGIAPLADDAVVPPLLSGDKHNTVETAVETRSASEHTINTPPPSVEQSAAKWSADVPEPFPNHSRALWSHAQDESTADILDQIKGEVEKQMNAHEGKKWTIHFAGRTVVLRDKVQKLVTWLDKFKAIGDVVTSYDPASPGTSVGGNPVSDSVYAAILRFLPSVTNGYQDGVAVRALRATFSPDEVSDLLAECRKSESAERVRMLQWMSTIPFEDMHNQAKDGRTHDTGLWLLAHKQFNKWRLEGASMTLWVYGPPGYGKTKLMSTVVDHLLGELEDDEALAYFYCDRNQADRRGPEPILRSCIRQLATSRKYEGVIHPSLRRLYQKYETSAFAKESISTEVIKQELIILANTFRITTIVIDALDECCVDTRSNLIEALAEIATESARPVRVLMSARPDGDLRYYMSSEASTDLTLVDTHEDISKFVAESVYGRPKDAPNLRYWREKITDELRQAVCEVLIEKSRGMFQGRNYKLYNSASYRTNETFEDDLASCLKSFKTFTTRYGPRFRPIKEANL
ncbi:hypothetical protein DL771_004098 [Monosporascus sp. 5C6A]|nr:hypothetical protein DL771_004098 [Monosporascus sp. 5C6A]